ENEELRIKSETDQLTGLANRFGLNNRGREIFARCIDAGEPVAIGMLDIDYFKAYNDNYGHQMGDACIVGISKILKALQEEGLLFAARYGGDEFVVIVHGSDQNGVEEIAKRIQRDVNEAGLPHAFSESSAFVTVSQGYYVGVPEQGQTLMDYFSVADSVMYKVKKGSKNSYQIKVADEQGEVGANDASEDTDLISWSTSHDYLTRLLNREGFAREVSRVLRENPDEDYYIVRSNIKDFKLVNQLFGYEKGNEILVGTAEMLRSGKLDTEVVGRIHGDHFAFLIKRSSFDEDVIRNCFTLQSKKVDYSEFALRFHIGVYAVTDRSMDISLMCDRANIAIASIQSNSESNIAYYDDVMMESILKENVVIAEFESALAAKDFRLFLQPLVDTEGKPVGAEALARWVHSEDGRVVQPDEFIPTLEKAGLIHKMDLFMWEEAARIVKSWQGTSMADLSISVNISPKDILYVDIGDTFESLIERYGIKPGQLNLEFTESTLISNVEQYIALISFLREKGFHVEIDDFGSGYSSLNMLKDIHADILKIDKGFLREIENRDRSRSILASIVDMSKKLNMAVIAEGVETESQLEFLRDIGCDMFQGYYFSRPIEVDAFVERYGG
ncbi:MAG: EAL domain-containing protein, partial [Eggerthellaceae bacterium]|nr:EAL domain-containing protein [Eggerthellaceae bacterium]